MAQTNFTPILTYKSDTATSIPLAGNLTNSANGAELAVNTADKRLFTKDSGGNVVELGTNPSSVTLPNGTANGVVYANNSKVLTTGSALTYSGALLTNTVSDAGTALKLAGATGKVRVRPYVDSTFGVVFDSTNAAENAYLPMSFYGTNIYTNPDTAAIWRVGGSEQMRLTSTGLGIGNVPAANTRITVRTAAQTDAAFAADNGVNTGFKVQFAANLTSIGNDFNNPLAFLQNNSEQMRLTSTGLGIGTSSPAYKLDVAGAARVNSGSAGGLLQFGNGASTASRSWRIWNDVSANGDFVIGQSTTQTGSTYTDRLYISASGNLGIGTSSPTAKLDVRGLLIQATASGETNTTVLGAIVGTSNGYEIIQSAGNALTYRWRTGANATAMVLDSSGNLGIGTSSPGAKLDIVGSGKATTAFAVGDSSGNFSGSMVNESDASKSVTFNADPGNAGASSFMRWNIDGSERMRLNASGNLGIGTSSPGAKLTVVGNQINTVADDAYAAAFNATTGNVRILPYSSANAGSALVAYSAGYAGNGPLAIDTSLTRFLIGGTERMRLDSSGNLGLGVTSPSARLHILGAGSSDNTATNPVAFIQANATLLNAIKFNGAVNTDIFFGRSANADAFVWGTVLEGERMRLDRLGNLGLGVTPSAWNADYRAVQAGVNGSIAGRVGASNTFDVTTNAFRNTAGNWQYMASSGVSRYSLDGSTSSHIWFTAPSGTAGNAITFTQAMTLDASGRLMVGTTSPVSSGITITGGYWSRSADLGTVGGVVPSNGGIVDVSSFNGSGGTITFTTANTSGSNAERARIDSSGNLLVGTTTTDIWTGSATNTGFKVEPNGTITAARSEFAAVLVKRTTSDGNAVEFARGTAQVGSISVTGSATAYNTSSDYRLKNTIAPMTGALAKVALLKPCTYKWNADGSDGEGFIAHELAEVVPQCVTGHKDAVDAEGKPQYQGIDTSFLVATLTAAIQEQQAIINSLKARLDAANL